MTSHRFTSDEVQDLCQEALTRLNKANSGKEFAPQTAWEDAYGMARGFWVQLISILLNEVLKEKSETITVELEYDGKRYKGSIPCIGPVGGEVHEH